MDETIVVMVRGIIGFFTLLIFTRLLGKQQVSQLTFFDYILGITIGSTASSLTTDLTSRAWIHFVGIFIWTSLGFLTKIITIKNRKASKYIGGEPVVVVMNGQIMEDTMKKTRYRISDLMEQLREKDVFDISEVEFAVLETSGKLSVQKKSQYQNLTPKDMDIDTDYKGLSTELIYDGVIIDQNLKAMNLDRLWLNRQLNKLGIKDSEDVMTAVINSSGKLYVDTYKDEIEVSINISDYPGAN